MTLFSVTAHQRACPILGLDTEMLRDILAAAGRPPDAQFAMGDTRGYAHQWSGLPGVEADAMALRLSNVANVELRVVVEPQTTGKNLCGAARSSLPST